MQFPCTFGHHMQQQNGKMLLMLQCLGSQSRHGISLKVGFLRDNSYFIYAWSSLWSWNLHSCIAGWNSINVPLTAFSSFVAAVNLNAISQLKIEGAPSGTSTVFLDNLYFYKGLPLPIKLSSFEVTKENKTAILNWNTSLENNNRGFNVLRSANGTKWETLTFVNGLGYSSTDHAYTFTDVNPIAGVNYYKLKQEDFDGKFNYSEIRAVRFGDKATFNFTLFPNPTSQRVFIDVSNLKQANATVNIVNAAGVVVLSKYVSVLNGYFNLSLDVSKLAKGNYFIQIQNSDNKNISKALIIE